MATENGITDSLLGSICAKSKNLFATSSATILTVLLVLLAIFTNYTEKHQTDADVQRYYTWYLHVSRLALNMLLLYRAMPCHAMSYHAVPRQATSCHALRQLPHLEKARAR